MPKEKTFKRDAASRAALWIGGAALVVLGTVAVAAYSVSDEAQAGSGSPLYGFAVHEALEGLKGGGAKAPAAQGEVCKDCGKIHPPAQHANVAAAIPDAVPAQGADAVPVQAADTVPVGEYYYCQNCQAYHRRQPGTAIPPGAPEGPAGPMIMPPLLPADAPDNTAPAALPAFDPQVVPFPVPLPKNG